MGFSMKYTESAGFPQEDHMDLVSGDEEVPTQTLSLEASRWRMWRLGFRRDFLTGKNMGKSRLVKWKFQWDV